MKATRHVVPPSCWLPSPQSWWVVHEWPRQGWCCLKQFWRHLFQQPSHLLCNPSWCIWSDRGEVWCNATVRHSIALHFSIFYQNLLQNGLLRMKYILRILVYIVCLHFYVCSICVALSLFLSKFAQKWTLMKYILRILVYVYPCDYTYVRTPWLCKMHITYIGVHKYYKYCVMYVFLYVRMCVRIFIHWFAGHTSRGGTGVWHCVLHWLCCLSCLPYSDSRVLPLSGVSKEDSSIYTCFSVKICFSLTCGHM